METDVKSKQYSYTALTYTWGDHLDQRPIECDGRKHLVTRNLHSALRRPRAIGQKVIWTDAICINQSTEPLALREREAQVQLMGRIYAQAKKVIADLGDADDDFQPALKLSLRIWRKRTYFEKIDLMRLPDLKKNGLPNYEQDIWLLWTKFMGRPWFQRVWVIQEFALSATSDSTLRNADTTTTRLQ